MATSTTPKLTTCSICFETFKTRRCLPCLHTFCEECISKYILSVLSKEGAPKGQINCPICRMTVKQPEGIDKAEWGKRLPHNHLMVSILHCESIKEGKICDACERENETESAVHWCYECRDSLCEKCVAWHRKYRTTKDHKVVRLTDLDKSSFTAFDNLTCDKHPEKKLEAFCTDHELACCITCVTLEHRKCENVGTIESAAEDIRQSTALTDLEKELTDMDEHLNDKTKQKEKNIAEIKKTCGSIKDEVKAVRARIDIHLDEIQEKTMKDLSAAEKEIIPKLENDRDSLEGQRSIVSNCLEVLRTGLKYASHAQLLAEFDKLKIRKSAVDKYLTEEVDDRAYKIRYETIDKLEQIQQIETFGRIDRTDGLPNINMLQGTTKAIQTIPTSSSGFFTGGIIMEDDSILIAQYSAKKLELYSKSGALLSHLQVDGNALSVELTGKENGVVSVCSTNTLVFFDIVGGSKLTETSRKSLGTECFDVCLYDGNLYVACRTQIKILDLNGNEKDTIVLPSEALFLDIDPKFRTLCYGSSSYHVLTCIDLSGTEIFQYSSPDLRGAAGVSYDFAGNTYVVGNSSGNVHQLSRSGQLNKVLVTGLSSSYALRFKRNSSKFLTNSEGKSIIYEIV